MELFEIAQWLESTAIGTWVREGRGVAPIVSGLHLIAIALVFGTILVVDLRLVGIPSNARSLKFLTADVLKWTWGAFLFALITGVLMIAANATIYYSNTLMQVKLVLLFLAGVNMFIFERFTFRHVEHWDKDVPTPFGARAAGVISLILWISIIFAGRWIGYTKDIPMPDIDLNDSLGGFL